MDNAGGKTGQDTPEACALDELVAGNPFRKPLDCTTYKVSNIVPLRGQVLIEIVEPTVSPGGIAFPETYAHYIDEDDAPRLDQPTHQEAIVRKFGVGTSVDCVNGDRVIVRRGAGRTVNQPPRRLKLVRAEDLLAVFV